MSLFPREFILILGFLWDTLTTWWWLFLPFFLFNKLLSMWKYSRTIIYDDQKMKAKIVDVRVPAEDILRPFRAMEAVFAGVWQIYDPPNAREKWLEGQFTGALSIEIVSDGGEIHFYLRYPRKDSRAVESAIYSQYPNAEMREVEDYVKNFPTNIPNKEWDMYVTDFKLKKPDPYPIRTFKYFEGAGGEGKEEQRVDPMGILLESLSQLRPGEHIWLQIRVEPVLQGDPGVDIVGKAQKTVRKIVGRPEPEKGHSMRQDVTDVSKLVLLGKEKTEEEQRPLFDFPEMRLTPGEREIVEAIEEKASKHLFRCCIRSLYVAKREVYFAPSKALLYNYLTQFGTEHLNAIVLDGKIKTKSKTFLLWFLDKRIAYMRKRRIQRQYKMRVSYYFPRPGATFLLNTEELASLFHFPGKMVAPGAAFERISSKKGEAPPKLPVE